MKIIIVARDYQYHRVPLIIIPCVYRCIERIKSIFNPDIPESNLRTPTIFVEIRFLRENLPARRRSLTTGRSFERNNHRNSRRREREREREGRKDFRRFTLRSGCAPALLALSTIRGRNSETPSTWRGDGHARIHIHRMEGEGRYRQTILPTQTGLRIRSVHTLPHMTAQDNPI